MTRGWAWTAFVLLVLIPSGLVVAIVYLFTGSPGDSSDPESMEGEWFPLAVFFFYFLWLVLCAAGALLSAIIGTVRSRRHPEVAAATVISVLVWVGLGLLISPVVLSLLGGGVEALFS